MATKLEEYEKLTRGSGEGPSGMHYEWRTASNVDVAAELGAIPTLVGSKDEPDADAIQRNLKFNHGLILRTLLVPRPVKPGEDPGTDGIPVDRITNLDTNWLVARIMSGTGLTGPAADTAKELL